MASSQGIVVPYSYKSRYIRISSSNRSNPGSSNSDFTVVFPSEGGIVDSIAACYIKSAYCPNVFNNVQSFNNLLVISDSTFTYNVFVPVGQYSIVTFITALTTAINAEIAPNTVIITQSPQENLIFTFSAGTPYQFYYPQSTISAQIGLTGNAFDTTPNVVTMQSIPNLIGVNAVYINSRAIATSMTIDSTNATSVIEILNINSAYGQTAYSNYESDFNYIQYEPYEPQKSFRNIDIQLTDGDGNILEWAGGVNTNFNFEMILKIYYN